MTCYNAGHVLGAAMFLVDIEGTSVLYTGDYSLENERHILKVNFYYILFKAEIPKDK